MSSRNNSNGTMKFKFFPKPNLPSIEATTGPTGPKGAKGEDYINTGSGWGGSSGFTGITGVTGPMGMYTLDNSGNIPLSNDLIPTFTYTDCNCDCETIPDVTNVSLGSSDFPFKNIYSNGGAFGPINLSGNSVIPATTDVSNGFYVNLGSSEKRFHQIFTEKVSVNDIVINDPISNLSMKMSFDLSNQQIIHTVDGLNSFQIYRVGVEDTNPVLETIILPFTGLSFFGFVHTNQINFQQINASIIYPINFTHLADYCN